VAIADCFRGFCCDRVSLILLRISPAFTRRWAAPAPESRSVRRDVGRWQCELWADDAHLGMSLESRGHWRDAGGGTLVPPLLHGQGAMLVHTRGGLLTLAGVLSQ